MSVEYQILFGLNAYYCRHGVNLQLGAFSCPECSTEREDNFKDFFDNLFEQLPIEDNSVEHS